uniref:Methyltransferase type 11 domain-containing protein n=1 Tax=Oryza brachyantha TaxID=4533 RepID=J3MPT8_ORYBR
MDQYCDGKSKKPGTKSRRCRCSATMLTMLLFVITNSVSVLLSSGAGAFLLRRYKPDSVRLWAWDDSAALLDDLNATHRFQDDLERYMEYKPGGECPSDEALAHQLMRNGCDPLPRRRCRPPSPARYVQPAPLPKSLWTIPPDTTVVWDAYRCKNYSCLAHGGGEFDLRGREKGRWMRDDGALTYSIDGVLAARPNGTVRIGLDIGGGCGPGAARMRERGVTVVTTTSMNSGGPSGSLIASRGLVPVHVSPAHRLPFFDGTLDIVHWTPELGSRPPPVTDVSLEFAVFDIYRVMRPGGLLWLDHFVFSGEQLSATTDRVGFRRVRWNTGKKLVSALLEKPMT